METRNLFLLPLKCKRASTDMCTSYQTAYCLYLGMKERQALHCVQRQQHFHQELFVLSFERKRKTIDDAVKPETCETSDLTLITMKETDNTQETQTSKCLRTEDRVESNKAGM